MYNWKELQRIKRKLINISIKIQKSLLGCNEKNEIPGSMTQTKVQIGNASAPMSSNRIERNLVRRSYVRIYIHTSAI